MSLWASVCLGLDLLSENLLFHQLASSADFDSDVKRLRAEEG